MVAACWAPIDNSSGFHSFMSYAGLLTSWLLYLWGNWSRVARDLARIYTGSWYRGWNWTPSLLIRGVLELFCPEKHPRGHWYFFSVPRSCGERAGALRLLTEASSGDSCGCLRFSASHTEDSLLETPSSRHHWEGDLVNIHGASSLETARHSVLMFTLRLDAFVLFENFPNLLFSVFIQSILFNCRFILAVI